MDGPRQGVDLDVDVEVDADVDADKSVHVRPPRPRAGASPVASYFALVPGDELVARRAAASRGELPVLRAHRVSVSCGELPSLGNERARRASVACTRGSDPPGSRFPVVDTAGRLYSRG